MTGDIETRAERRARAHAAAMLFDVEGGSAKAMSALRCCASVSEMYQIRFEDTRTSEDFLRETMQRGRKRRVRR